MSTATTKAAETPLAELAGGRPILCVDDEPTHLMLLTRYLSKAGLTSITANNGIEGLEVLKYHKPALILLDLRMPKMDGLSFLAHLRNIDGLQDIPVVLQTAGVTKENLVKSMKLGISGAIAKPFKSEVMLAKVRQVLLECSSASAKASAEGSGEGPPIQDHAANEPSGKGSMNAVDLEAFLEEAAAAKALPSTVREVQTVTGSEESDVAELVEVIRQDTMLSTVVLRMANSAEYGRGNTRSLEEAVSALGFQQIGKLTVQVGMMELADTNGQSDNFSSYNFWLHTIVVSNLAHRFATMTGKCHPDEAMLAGLLHDLGTLLVAQIRPDLIVDLARAASSNPAQILHDEKSKIGWSFAQIGEMLLSKWNIPESLAQAVGHHRDTKEGIDQLPGSARDLTLIIKAADIAAQAALTDPFCNYPVLVGGEAMQVLLEWSNINQETMNREVNAIVREAETLAMCTFDAKSAPAKPIHKPMSAVAVVRPDRLPASPLNIFLEKASQRVSCFRTVPEVSTGQWDAIYIDAPLGGMRFADRCLRDFDSRGDLHKIPTMCLVTAEMMTTFEGAYGHLPLKLIEAPCWARRLLPSPS